MQNKLLNTVLILFTLSWSGTLLNGQEEVSYRLAIQCVEWSPDSKQLVFSAQYGKTDWSDYAPERWQLFLLDVKSKKTRHLADGALFATFSPDGKSVAFSQHQEGDWNIVIQDLRTGTVRNLAADPESRESGPSWSPDGSQLVFYGGKDKARELFVINADGSGLQQISHSAPHASYNPAWSPNSDRICYYLEKGDNRDQIYLTDSKGSFHQNLSQDTLHNYYPGWAPGNRIIYASNNNTLRIMRADGSEKATIPDLESFYGRIAPNRKKIAYIRKDGATQAIALRRFPFRGKTKQIFTLQHYLATKAATQH